jgi:predicted nucleic acid-binding Zn ribbon protein
MPKKKKKKKPKWTRRAQRRIKYCEVCFDPFSPIRDDATICSPKCRMKAWRAARRPGRMLSVTG